MKQTIGYMIILSCARNLCKDIWHDFTHPNLHLNEENLHLSEDFLQNYEGKDSRPIKIPNAEFLGSYCGERNADPANWTESLIH